MSETLFIVHPETKELRKVSSVSLSAIGIKEREDLEAWVIAHPEILGEPLLIVTSEFDRFDRSSRRLDVLALDKDGKLVVVELKLDLSHSLADQQAIRYAAFCSAMTMDDVRDTMAAFRKCSTDEAQARIAEFLENDSPPALDDRPRIILAAGALEDQELTSTVLWLRKFGLDMSCVELTPFRLPDGDLIVVPKTIIPLPETQNYEVRVQKKEEARVRASSSVPAEIPALFTDILKAFKPMGPRFTRREPPRSWFMQLSVGHSSVHYEWMPYWQKGYLAVAIHFESPDKDVNEARLAALVERQADIVKGIDATFVAERWGKKWTKAEFRLPFEDLKDTVQLAPEAARLMKILIDRTWPLVEPVLEASAHD